MDLLALSGALSGADPEIPDGIYEILADMRDPDDSLASTDPNYKAVRLIRMVALSHALKPMLRSIAVERGITDETGWPIGKARDVDDRDIERAPETPPRPYYRSPTDHNFRTTGDDL